jgi:hypothetical protein
MTAPKRRKIITRSSKADEEEKVDMEKDKDKNKKKKKVVNSKLLQDQFSRRLSMPKESRANSSGGVES